MVCIWFWQMGRLALDKPTAVSIIQLNNIHNTSSGTSSCAECDRKGRPQAESHPHTKPGENHPRVMRGTAVRPLFSSGRPRYRSQREYGLAVSKLGGTATNAIAPATGHGVFLFEQRAKSAECRMGFYSALVTQHSALEIEI